MEFNTVRRSCKYATDTTAAMSAVIGGCQSLSVNPYDELISPPDEFTYRIARNQQVIFKEEAYLDKVADPSRALITLKYLRIR